LLRAFILPTIIFDLAFLPMFHVGGLPFKLSYLLIIFLVLATKSSYSSLLRGRSRDFLALFGTLATMTLLGTAVYLLVYNNTGYGLSARNIIIYLLAPLAFWVGSRDSRSRHNYLIVFILAYAAITLLMSIFYQELGWLTRFYGLQSAVASGAYSFRSQGLFENANISALFMTLLYMYLVAGIKNGFVKTSPVIFYIVTFAAFGTVTVLQSRNQTVALVAITLIFLASLSGTVWLRKILFGLVISLAAVVFLSAPLGKYLGYDAFSRLQYSFSRAKDVSDSTQSFSRPIRALDEATERWLASPLVGTGFDSNGSAPFEGTRYHNDWLYILTSAGLLGVITFALIAYLMGRLDLILIVPFIFPGITNSLVFAPSNFLLLMLLAGIIWRRKIMYGKQPSENSVASTRLPTPGRLPHPG